MGDAGVACAPSQHAVEKFTNPEILCGSSTGTSAKAFFKRMKLAADEESGRGNMKSDTKVKRIELEKGEFDAEQQRRGDFEPGEVQNGELDKGEFVPDHKWKNQELEKGEFVPDKWSKYEVEKGEIVRCKSRRSSRELERAENGFRRGRKAETRKYELISKNWYKGDRAKEREMECSPDDVHRRKDLGRSGRDHRNQAVEVSLHEKELGEFQYEQSNRRGQSKDHGTGAWSKWSSMEPENRKHWEEYNDCPGSRRRRITEENSKGIIQDRQTKGASFSFFRVLSTSKHSTRHHDGQVRSPGQSERCSVDHSRHDNQRERKERSPSHSERSPYQRARNRDHRDRALSHLDRSPHDRSRPHDFRDLTPAHAEQSPHDRSPARDQCRRIGTSERLQKSRDEGRLGWRDSSGKDVHKNSSTCKSSTRNDRSDSNANNKNATEQESQNFVKEPSEPPPPPPLLLPPPPSPIPLQAQTNGSVEDLPSMEEDMDICDTPPHVSLQLELHPNMGNWYYLDHFGMEQGPSKLSDLKRLVDEGLLASDHLIKHSDSDRWVTVENAASPLVFLNSPSIVSDVITQMASPPEAPGNLLADLDVDHGTFASSMDSEDHLDTYPNSTEVLEDHHIDERVEALLDGYPIIYGKELESIGEALSADFVLMDTKKWVPAEEFKSFQPCTSDSFMHAKEDGNSGAVERFLKESAEIRASAPFDTENLLLNSNCDWYEGRWSCMGGDWKRNDEPPQDKLYKKRLVLNEGYPLCLMPKSGYEDPRWCKKDDMYQRTRIRKLDLHPWAFSWTEDKNDSVNETSKGTIAGKPVQAKLHVPRCVKGTMLPVIRINACVVKDQGSSLPHSRVRTSDRHTGRFSRSCSSGDRSSFSEGSVHPKKHERDIQSLHRCRTILNTPKDRVSTVDELSLHLGDWYYLDGGGHEHGPSTYSELKNLAAKGIIPKHSSVVRKDDNIWLPVCSTIMTCESIDMKEEGIKNHSLSADFLSCNAVPSASQPFHKLHPQFIGYTRGKLHELVMKSYKNREFASAINEVLDPWMVSKQPKKDIDKHFPFNSSITRSSSVVHEFSGERFWKSDDGSGVYNRIGKRARLHFGESDGDSEAEDDLSTCQRFNCSFDDMYAEAALFDEVDSNSHGDSDDWGLLNVCLLARVFHFLRADLRSFTFAAVSCKRWKTAAGFYKRISNNVDLSCLGLNCTDSVFLTIMSCYGKSIKSVFLAGCSNISPQQLEDVLRLFPSITFVDIRGCNQLGNLVSKYHNMTWFKGSRSSYAGNHGETYARVRSLKQITEKRYSSSKAFWRMDTYLDGHDGCNSFGEGEPYMDKKDAFNHASRQGYYRDKRLRKSLAALSRHAQMRQLTLKRQYRKMEEFISSSLKEIMRRNTTEYFINKVARIESRMKSGFYFRNGLGSLKEDITRMCRDALKVKNRGEATEMNQMMMSFIQLLKNLDKNPKSANERDDSESGISSVKHGKKQNKLLGEKKGTYGINCTSYASDGAESGVYAFEREIRRSLSKLKRRNMGSESDSSDDLSEDFKDGAETTDSETESDPDLCSVTGEVETKEAGYLMVSESVDSTCEDREWGARMTKASLVPPITRKYEVIDKYLIVADEEEVRRKMQVALPDDYEEKLVVQKIGKEKSDMQLPDVKDYKPRKVLGEEVIEQEVYGIDPHTYNLILDSMPDDLGWLPTNKTKFIEEILLQKLNKQARRFTRSGNAPMEYNLEPVIRDIQQEAEEEGSTDKVQMCRALLKAMRLRINDNYVAYRKGLGVVCNKDEGFGKDDFVVEFLGEVYPAWKWYEKEDGIRSLKENKEESAAEFYNIYLERPKGDQDGYDLVVVDAMHKANYASRICHSCKPNCEAKVTAVDGQYQIGIYTIRPIAYGEEITFDYNTVTDSKEEIEQSVCLCGSQVCKGSYLSYNGEGAFQKVLKDWHGILHRHKLILEACDTNFVSVEDWHDLSEAGLGACLLSGLPDWLVSYSANLVRFINFERTKLPDVILKHNVEEKRKFVSKICLEDERSDAELQAEGVYNSRLQNMVITLDKVRYVMRCVFGDAKMAPPPIQKLTPEAVISALWKGERSLVEELLQCMAPYVEPDLLHELKLKIGAHDPSGSGDLRRGLRKSLLWLRDELRNLPSTYKCRHDAAADLIHLYAYTKHFFKVQEYKTVESPPVYISPLDLGPKYANKIGPGLHEYCKKYDENYCLGQLMYWHSQATADPDSRLSRSWRGCLSLPDVSSFYAGSQKPVNEHVYSSRTLKSMLYRMEKQPQRPWPKDQIWVFKDHPKILGSPMMDAVLGYCPVDKEMLHWLRSRPTIYDGE